MAQIDPRVPVLLTSGYNEQVAARHFGGTGPVGFIQKPYLPTELIDQLCPAPFGPLSPAI